MTVRRRTTAELGSIPPAEGQSGRRRGQRVLPDAQREPFKSKHHLNRWLDKRVKPKFPWFHTYLGRIMCANAQLIEWKYDSARVAEWLRHESVDMTRRTYEHEARLHRKKYGDGWLERAFKSPPGSTETAESAERKGLAAAGLATEHACA